MANKRNTKVVAALTVAAGLLTVAAGLLARRAMQKTVDDITDELDEEGVLLPEEAEDAQGDFVDAEGAAEDQ